MGDTQRYGELEVDQWDEREQQQSAYSGATKYHNLRVASRGDSKGLAPRALVASLQRVSVRLWATHGKRRVRGASTSSLRERLVHEIRPGKASWAQHVGKACRSQGLWLTERRRLRDSRLDCELPLACGRVSPTTWELCPWYG